MENNKFNESAHDLMSVITNTTVENISNNKSIHSLIKSLS